MASPIPTTSASNAFLTKLVPASTLKQLRATACLLCYDHIHTQPSMRAEDMSRMAYTLYHGNEEQNIISQIHLLVNGTAKYGPLYDKEIIIVTDRNTATDTSTAPNNKLVLKQMFHCKNSAHRFVSGTHFSEEILCCPQKNTTSEKCSGRYILDNARLALRYIKKAIVIAEEWLNDGELPSDKSWEEMYEHLLSCSNEISPKEAMFTGFFAFVCLSKYNEDGKNLLNVLALNDGDDHDFGKGGRSESRKRLKKNKDDLRQLETGTVSPFAARGLPLDTRMQIIEVAQFEDSKMREDIRYQLSQLNSRMDHLLRERSQQIEIAKIICPVYDKTDTNWELLDTLTQDIQRVKNRITTNEGYQAL